MEQEQLIAKFLQLAVVPASRELRRTTKLGPRQIDLLVGGLNARKQNSLVVENLNAVSKALGVSNGNINILRQKGYIKKGAELGEWILTNHALKRLREFVESPGETSGPEHEKKTLHLKPGLKTASKKKVATQKRMPRKTEVEVDVSSMTVDQIVAELDRLERVKSEATARQEQIMRQFGKLAEALRLPIPKTRK